MQVRTHTKVAMSAFALTTLTLPALAGTPKAIDRVPTDAPVVIGVPNVSSFLKDMDQINAMMGEDASAEMMMGIMMIRGMEGLNLDGSLAMAIYPDMDEEDDIDDEEFYLFVPVSDFNALSQGREADDGVVPYPLPDEQMGYLRNLGDGFALFGDDADKVREFNAAKGSMNANNALIGQSGQSIASDSDIFMYVNFSQIGDMIDAAKSELEEQGEMVGMMGGEEAQQGYDQFLNMVETLVEDGQSFITGMNFDATQGISFDAGVQFKEGSDSASYLHNPKANASKYLNNVPSGDYFFAATVDSSGKGMKALFSDFLEMSKDMDHAGMGDFFNLGAMMTKANGGAQVMGASNPMGMTGLLSTITSYTDTDNSKALISSLGDMYNDMNGQGAQGVSFTSSFDETGTKIEDSVAHAYNMRIDLVLDENIRNQMGGMNPQMIMQMMFGAALGPSGYIGSAGNGVVQTMNQDQFAYTRAVDAANGKDTLGADQFIQNSAAHLQNNTVLEFYFGADHTLNTVGPMLMMFGVVPEFEPLDAHAPVALGFTADAGGATARLWLPMDVIGSIMELIPEEAFDQFDGGDDEDNMDF